MSDWHIEIPLVGSVPDNPLAEDEDNPIQPVTQEALQRAMDFLGNEVNNANLGARKARIQNADNIANLQANDKKVICSANDTTPAYLEDKITAGSNVTVATQNDGANENIQISTSADAWSSITWEIDATGAVSGTWYNAHLYPVVFAPCYVGFAAPKTGHIKLFTVTQDVDSGAQSNTFYCRLYNYTQSSSTNSPITDDLGINASLTVAEDATGLAVTKGDDIRLQCKHEDGSDKDMQRCIWLTVQIT